MVDRSITAIVQARMSSSRLPGKVLEPLAGDPVVVGVLRRLKASGVFAHIVLATSNELHDDILADAVSAAGFLVVRGSLDDVLERYCQASDEFPSHSCFRITADCPFVDAGCVSDLVNFFYAEGCDYASNALEPTLPDGFDCEIFTREALLKARDMATTIPEREHVTYYMYRHPELFSISSLVYEDDYSEWRVTLDTKEDLELVRELVALSDKPYLEMTLNDVIELISDNPHLKRINAMHGRNGALEKTE